MVYVIAAYHDIAHHIDAKNHEVISARILRDDKNLKRFFTDDQIKIMNKKASKIKVKYLFSSPVYAKYRIKDLDRGYGLVLGNSLKRILIKDMREYDNPVTKVEFFIDGENEKENLVFEIYSNSLMTPAKLLKIVSQNLNGFCEEIIEE